MSLTTQAFLHTKAIIQKAAELNRHLLESRPTQDLSFCHFCNRQFPDSLELLQHQQRHHWRCFVCSSHCSSFSILIDHCAFQHKSALQGECDGNQGKSVPKVLSNPPLGTPLCIPLSTTKNEGGDPATAVRLKLFVGKSIFRTTLGVATIEQLQHVLCCVLPPHKNFLVRYEDEDEDLITLSSTQDILEAMAIQRVSAGTQDILKLVVTPSPNVPPKGVLMGIESSTQSPHCERPTSPSGQPKQASMEVEHSCDGSNRSLESPALRKLQAKPSTTLKLPLKDPRERSPEHKKCARSRSREAAR